MWRKMLLLRRPDTFWGMILLSATLICSHLRLTPRLARSLQPLQSLIDWSVSLIWLRGMIFLFSVLPPMFTFHFDPSFLRSRVLGEIEEEVGGIHASIRDSSRNHCSSSLTKGLRNLVLQEVVPSTARMSCHCHFSENKIKLKKKPSVMSEGFTCDAGCAGQVPSRSFDM